MSIKSYLPAMSLGVFGMIAISVSQLAPPDSGTVVVLLGKDAGTVELFSFLERTDTRLVDVSDAPGVFVVNGQGPDLPKRLKRAGAHWVFSDTGTRGCSGE